MGIQYCAGYCHFNRWLNNWIDLLVQNRVGWHGFVTSLNLYALLMTDNIDIACIPFLISTGYIRLVSTISLDGFPFLNNSKARCCPKRSTK